MADTDARTRNREHFTEEDWFDFAHQQASPSVRASLERHLEKGCSRCTQTVRLWRAVFDVADQEAAYRPPDEALRQLKGDFALRRPKGLLERVAEQAALVFDSFRQPQPMGVRGAGPSPRQLLYKAGRYAIRLRLESAADTERVDRDSSSTSTVTRSRRTSRCSPEGWEAWTDKTNTREFVLEPDAAENSALCRSRRDRNLTVERQGTEGEAVRAPRHVGSPEGAVAVVLPRR